MSISSIGTSITKFLGKQFNKDMVSSKTISKINRNFVNPEAAAGAALVTSIVSKDLVGCVLYTSQSATNKKIPPDKRPFVASLDLVNGFLMVFGQYIFGKTLIEKIIQPKLESKLLNGSKNAEVPSARFASGNLKKLVSEVFDFGNAKISKKALKMRAALEATGLKMESLKNMAPEELAKLSDDVLVKLVKKVGKGSTTNKLISTGFAILVSTIGTTALVKRTLVPLVSTPLAGKLSDKFIKDKDGKPQENIVNTKMDPATKMANNTVQEDKSKLNIVSKA